MYKLASKVVPRKLKKKIRFIYHSKIEQHFEKVKFFGCKLNNHNKYIDKIKNKDGLEIGGPSFFFRNFLKVYKNINSLDNINFKSKTIWRNNKNKTSFVWNSNKNPGKEMISCSTNISFINNESYDFILSSHQLEHVANPIKALFEFKRILKKKGILILVLPNFKYNFDHKREITTFNHILNDFESNTGEDDKTHLEEVLSLTDFKNNPTEYETFKKLAQDNYNNRVIHHHIFDRNLVNEVCNFVNFKIVLSNEIKKKFPSFVFLCEKN